MFKYRTMYRMNYSLTLNKMFSFYFKTDHNTVILIVVAVRIYMQACTSTASYYVKVCCHREICSGNGQIQENVNL